MRLIPAPAATRRNEHASRPSRATRSRATRTSAARTSSTSVSVRLRPRILPPDKSVAKVFDTVKFKSKSGSGLEIWTLEPLRKRDKDGEVTDPEAYHAAVKRFSKNQVMRAGCVWSWRCWGS